MRNFDRLGNEIECPVLHCLHRFFNRAVSGHDEYRNCWIDFPLHAEDLQPGQGRQAEVRQDQAVSLFPDFLDGKYCRPQPLRPYIRLS